MIRKLLSSDFNSILRIINDASQAYKDIIPYDRWREPYMATEELKEEIKSGIRFYGWFQDSFIIGVMGAQTIQDTTLIRHSYVLTSYQRRGFGMKLLQYLISLTETPKILVGTWKDAFWAIHFYKKYGFKLVSNKKKDKLLRKYWNIPERQIETSVVLKFIKNLK